MNFYKVIMALAISLIMGIITFAAFDARAGIFDAIKGHVEDVYDRVTHDDSFVEGNINATSMFRTDDAGRDPIHWADGTVQLIEQDGSYWIQLGSDFVSGPAPDLYIYAADSKVFDETSFYGSNRWELGKLQSGSGAQYYEIPAHQVEGHLEIVIWCKRFGAFIGATTLEVS